MYIEESLSENFYLSVRNELSEERFALLERLSHDLLQPDIYGRFASREAYYQTFKILNLSTQELRHRKIFLLRDILPRIKFHGRLLDAGPADGVLTKIVGKNFKEITLVDIDENSLKKVPTKFFKKCTNLELYNGSIMDIILPEATYDLIMLSHVLYYIPQEDWFYLIKKLFSLLKPNGVLFIALNGGQDKKLLINHFGGKSLEIDQLKMQCKLHISGTVEIFKSQEKFLSKDLNTMLHISNMHLNDGGAVAMPESLKNYLLQKHYNNEKKLFEFKTQQQFIVISKNIC